MAKQPRDSFKRQETYQYRSAFGTHQRQVFLFWKNNDKNEGIIFMTVSGEVSMVVPNAIIIMPPGSEISRSLKYFAGLEGIAH